MLMQTRKRRITSVASYPMIAAPTNLRATPVGKVWATHIQFLYFTTIASLTVLELATFNASNGNSRVAALPAVAPAHFVRVQDKAKPLTAAPSVESSLRGTKLRLTRLEVAITVLTIEAPGMVHDI